MENIIVGDIVVITKRGNYLGCRYEVGEEWRVTRVGVRTLRAVHPDRPGKYAALYYVDIPDLDIWSECILRDEIITIY